MALLFQTCLTSGSNGLPEKSSAVAAAACEAEKLQGRRAGGGPRGVMRTDATLNLLSLCLVPWARSPVGCGYSRQFTSKMRPVPLISMLPRRSPGGAEDGTSQVAPPPESFGPEPRSYF